MPARRRLVPRDERTTVNHEFTSVDQFVSEYVSNISRSGVFIRSRRPLPVGTRVNLRFTIILDELETIEGIGEVVRTSDDPRGMGVVFTHLRQHSQNLIARILTRRPSRAESDSDVITLPPVSGRPRTRRP